MTDHLTHLWFVPATDDDRALLTADTRPITAARELHGAELGARNGVPCGLCRSHEDVCTGHPGKIDLPLPIYSPAFYDELRRRFGRFCACGRPFGAQRTDRVSNALITRMHRDIAHKSLAELLARCPDCHAWQYVPRRGSEMAVTCSELNIPVWAWSSTEKMPTGANVQLVDLTPIHFARLGEAFARYVTHIVIVPPHTVRYDAIGVREQKSNDTKLLEEILVFVRALNDLIRPTRADRRGPAVDPNNVDTFSLRVMELWNNIQDRYNEMIVGRKSSAGGMPRYNRTNAAKDKTSIKMRMGGKRGKVRNRMLRKMEDGVSRMAITIAHDEGDNIGVRDYGMPDVIMDHLAVPDYVTPENIALYNAPNSPYKVQRYQQVGSTVTQVPPQSHVYRLGEHTWRNMVNGDNVLINRQPTLHGPSIQSMSVRRVAGETGRMNHNVCDPFNADFDGDEVNAHASVTMQAKIEAKERMSVDENIISPRHSGPCMAPVGNDIVAACEMSRPGVLVPAIPVRTILRCFYANAARFKVDDYAGYNQRVAELDARIADLKGDCSGRALYSLIFPADLKYERFEYARDKADGLARHVLIEDGRLVRGILAAGDLGMGMQSLIVLMRHRYGKYRTMMLMDDTQSLGRIVPTFKGLTFSMGDLVPRAPVRTHMRAILADVQQKAQRAQHEDEAQGILAGVVTKIGSVAFASLPPTSDYRTSVETGIKFTPSMLSHFADGGALGQQTLNGRRIRIMMKDSKRTLAYFPQAATSPEAFGFVPRSLMQGMDVTDLLLHDIAMGANMLTLAQQTPQLGYMTRSTSYGAGNAYMDYSGHVRDCVTGRVICFRWHEDNYRTEALRVVSRSELDPIAITESHVSLCMRLRSSGGRGHYELARLQSELSQIGRRAWQTLHPVHAFLARRLVPGAVDFDAAATEAVAADCRLPYDVRALCRRAGAGPTAPKAPRGEAAVGGGDEYVAAVRELAQALAERVPEVAQTDIERAYLQIMLAPLFTVHRGLGAADIRRVLDDVAQAHDEARRKRREESKVWMSFREVRMAVPDEDVVLLQRLAGIQQTDPEFAARIEAAHRDDWRVLTQTIEEVGEIMLPYSIAELIVEATRRFLPCGNPYAEAPRDYWARIEALFAEFDGTAHPFTRVPRAYVRLHLSPVKLFYVHKLSTQAVDWLLAAVREAHMAGMIAPGVALGFLMSTAVGAMATQDSFDAHRRAGASEESGTSRHVELIKSTKDIKNPAVVAHLLPGATLRMALEMQFDLELVRFGDVIENAMILNEPKGPAAESEGEEEEEDDDNAEADPIPLTCLRYPTSDPQAHAAEIAKWNNVLRYSSKGPFWFGDACIYFEVRRATLRAKRLSFKQFLERLPTTSDNASPKFDVIAIHESLATAGETIWVRLLFTRRRTRRLAIDDLNTKLRAKLTRGYVRGRLWRRIVKGCPHVTRVELRSRPGAAATEYYLVVRGVGALQAVLQHPYTDVQRSRCNNQHTVAARCGINAAARAYYNEFVDLLASGGGKIHRCFLWLYVAIMTNRGMVLGSFRSFFLKMGKSPLDRIGFETVGSALADEARLARGDALRSPIAATFTAAPMRVGTALPEVELGEPNYEEGTQRTIVPDAGSSTAPAPVISERRVQMLAPTRSHEAKHIFLTMPPPIVITLPQQAMRVDVPPPSAAAAALEAEPITNAIGHISPSSVTPPRSTPSPARSRLAYADEQRLRAETARSVSATSSSPATSTPGADHVAAIFGVRRVRVRRTDSSL